MNAEFLQSDRPDTSAVVLLNYDKFFFDDTRLLRSSPRIIVVGVSNAAILDCIIAQRPKAQVLLVEGCPPFFNRVYSDVIRANTSLLVQVQLAALFRSNKPVVLYRHTKSTSSGLFVTSDNQMEKYVVPGKTLSRIMHDAGYRTDVDLLLLNCEGAELYVLMELCESPQLRSRVHQVCLGIHSQVHAIFKYTSMVRELREYYEVIRLSDITGDVLDITDDYLLLRKRHEDARRSQG